MERKCVHFNGLQHDTCRAGCNYDHMDEGKRIAYRSALPCFKPDGGGTPTQQQSAAHTRRSLH